MPHLSELASHGIPACRRGSVVVAVGCVRQLRKPCRWRIDLLAGPLGCALVRIQRVTVAASTRSFALQTAQAYAARVAVHLAAGVSPGPARSEGRPPVACEPAPPYAAHGPLTHCQVTPIGDGFAGFELELTGAGWDGEIEMVGPNEAALWLLCNELTHALLTLTPSREAVIHRELVALLYARAAYRRSRCDRRTCAAASLRRAA